LRWPHTVGETGGGEEVGKKKIYLKSFYFVTIMEKMFGYYADNFISPDSELSLVCSERIKIYDTEPE
jgi:hypothetical protein